MRYGIKQYAEMPPEKIAAIEDKYRRHNVEYYGQLYRATPQWANRRIMRQIYRECDRRRRQGQNVVVGHVVPIKSKIVCGLHNEFNLSIITELQNMKDLNHTWPDMPNENLDLFPIASDNRYALLPLSLYK